MSIALAIGTRAADAAASSARIKGLASPGSPLERAHAPYFVQKLWVGDELARRPRLDVLGQLCRGKRVMHVGCVDWPITDPKASLHVQLDGLCQLDGFDIHDEAFHLLQPHVRGRLYSRWQDVTEPYDLVLAPEVLEHVPDMAGFLGQLDALGANQYVITVPDAFSCFRRHFDYLQDEQAFVEVVHPDHNCWFTPYTLANVIRKYTPWQLQGIWFFNGISLMAVATRPPAASVSATHASAATATPGQD